MAITLTGTGGIFKRVGVISGRIQSILNHQGLVALTAPAISAGTQYANILAQFTSATAQGDILDGYVANVLNISRAKQAEITALQTMAQNLLIRQVNDDTVLKAYTLPYAMAELLRQMGTATTSKVTACATAASATTQGVGFTGTAVCTSSITGPVMPNATSVTGTNAMDLQYIFPETITLKCTADAQTGGATFFQESFSFLGQTALVTDPLLWNFTNTYGATATNGSGCTGTLNVCSANSYQNTGPGQNVLNNGDFLSFTTNFPNQWTSIVSTPGTTVLDGGAASGVRGSTPSSLASTHSLQIVGTGGAELTAMKQQFNNSAGTTYAILPNTVYAFNFWAKITAGSTGTFVIDLVDGNSTVINDNNAVANSKSLDISTLTTSYTAVNGAFRTPMFLPATGVFLRIRMTTAVNNAHTLSISDLAMRPAVQAYQGGPYIALFNGGTANILGDYYGAPFTNDFGVASNRVGFQTIWNWLFGLRTMKNPDISQGNFSMQLPIVGTTAIADSFT